LREEKVGDPGWKLCIELKTESVDELCLAVHMLVRRHDVNSSASPAGGLT